METKGSTRHGATDEDPEDRGQLVRGEQEADRRSQPTTFAGYAATWFSEGQLRRGWKPTTVAQYRSVRKRLVAALGSMQLSEIRPRHVADYVRAASGTGLSAASVRRDLVILHAIFKTALQTELVDSNPAQAAEWPKVKRRCWRILEPAEVTRIAAAFADEQARTVFLTLLLTGLRRSELQRLRWRDIDLLDAVLRVRQSKSESGERAIALSRYLVRELSRHYQRSSFRGDDDLVFCHPTRGTTYRAETFDAALKSSISAAGIDASLRAFNDLRHASLTNGAAAGESPIALMTRAGHANMATTKRYLHLAGTVFRDEAERLEQRLLGVPPSV